MEGWRSKTTETALRAASGALKQRPDIFVRHSKVLAESGKRRRPWKESLPQCGHHIVFSTHTRMSWMNEKLAKTNFLRIHISLTQSPACDSRNDNLACMYDVCFERRETPPPLPKKACRTTFSFNEKQEGYHESLARRGGKNQPAMANIMDNKE